MFLNTYDYINCFEILKIINIVAYLFTTCIKENIAVKCNPTQCLL